MDAAPLNKRAPRDDGPGDGPDDGLVDRLAEALAEADLECLHPGQPGWARHDECRPEYESLAAVWRSRTIIDVADLRAVWSHWFDNDLSSYSPDELETIAVTLRNRAVAP